MRKNTFAAIAVCMCLSWPIFTFAQPDEKSKPKPCVNAPGAMTDLVKNEKSKQEREKALKDGKSGKKVKINRTVATTTSNRMVAITPNNRLAATTSRMVPQTNNQLAGQNNVH